jgi:hypothetical protein
MLGNHCPTSVALISDVRSSSSRKKIRASKRAGAAPTQKCAPLPKRMRVLACVGGYLLQGGYGWNSRIYGPACESVVGVDVITADGEQIHCDADNHADLYWAARGARPGRRPCNGRAGEERALRIQVGHEEAAALARTNDGQPSVRVDRRVVEAADTVAEVAGREAMSTRDDAHAMAVGPGIADAGDDFVGVDGLQDQLGIALGHC